MSFIGYSVGGYEALNTEINARKQKLLDILADFANIDAEIAACWIGEDATAYREELKKVVEATKSSVTEAYDALANQCRVTYEEWVSKQGMN